MSDERLAVVPRNSRGPGRKGDAATMASHPVGTRDEWLAARLELLEAEKELTRRGDELARRRQELPWVRIDKAYRFDTDEGRGCTGCSLVADHFDGVIPHLNGRDITLVCASIAPLQELQDYKRQMGWRFPWVSSLGSDFNYDFGVASTSTMVSGDDALRCSCCRQVNSWLTCSPYRRATAEAVVAGSRLSAAIRALSSSVQRRRRPTPVITSTRRNPSAFVPAVEPGLRIGAGPVSIARVPH